MTIDITEKLSFEEPPKLKIKNTEISVNADAPTMLKVMQILGDGKDVTPARITQMCDLLLPEAERKKLDKLKLQFNDFVIVVKAAISAVTGMDMDEVEEKEQ